MLNNAFDNFKPTIINNYKNYIRNSLTLMIDSLGPSLPNIYNDWNYAKIFMNIKHNFVKIDNKYIINEEALDISAKNIADMIIETWKNKITSKVENITDVKIYNLTSSSFHISGKRNGHNIVIVQNVIVNFSKLGKAFNQFPSIIYLDGKKISEKEYKTIGD